MKRVINKGVAIITCAPLAAVAAYAALAAAATSGYAQYKSGQTQKEAARYNAKMSEMSAKDTLQRGADAGAARREEAKRVAAQQNERLSGMGVSTRSGTPLGLLAETIGIGELDALTLENNAQRQAWGVRGQAKNDLYQGKMAARGGALSGVGTFLGGASSAYYGYKGATTKGATT